MRAVYVTGGQSILIDNVFVLVTNNIVTNNRCLIELIDGRVLDLHISYNLTVEDEEQK